MTLKDLQDAINNNEKEVATKLMKSADTLFTDYSKLISTLSFVKSKEMMAELLEYIPRSMIDFCSPGEISVLNIIIAYCIDLVKQLISKKHADINFLDGTGNTPLSLAVGTGKDVTFIEELIKLGADVNKRIRDELTPLHCAYQDKDVVALLIEHGADINAKDVHGRTILLSALQFKRKDEFILELINLGADIKIVDMDGNTVLHYVQSVNLINKFISMGIPINVKNNKGQTPLMTAVKFGEPEVVKILLQLGVDVDCFDLQLNSPFHFLKLKQENITRILELLIFCGCKVYTRNIDDETPLSHMLNRQLNRETIDPYKLIKYTLLANEFAALNTVDEVDLYLDDCNIQRYKEELSEMKLLNINYNNETYYSFCLEKAKFNKYFNETRCLYVHDEDEVKKLFPKLYAEIIMKMKTEKIRNDLLRFVDELIIQSKLYDEEADISPHSDGNNKITDTSSVDNSVNQAEENRADSSFSNPFQSNVVELNVDILYHVISYLNNIQIMNLYSATL